MLYPRLLICLLAAATAIGSSAVTAQDKPPEKAYENERVVTEPDGSRTRLVRWAIGSRDNIVTLRVPEVYVSAAMFFGCHRKDAVDPNCAQPPALALQAMMPDFSPPWRRRMTREEERRFFGIFIESVLASAHQWTETDRQQSRASIEFESLNSRSEKQGFPFIVKEPRFGLNRVGPNVHPAPDDALFDDFLFTSAQPFTSDELNTCTLYQPSERMRPTWHGSGKGPRMCRQFIETEDFFVCSVDEMPDPENAARGFCQHWFAVPSISAVVEVSYGRRYLKDWRKIKQQTLDFIYTLTGSNGGD